MTPEQLAALEAEHAAAVEQQRQDRLDNAARAARAAEWEAEAVARGAQPLP